jgi:methylenetetrahydrofolate reductase (NADPH)
VSSIRWDGAFASHRAMPTSCTPAGSPGHRPRRLDRHRPQTARPARISRSPPSAIRYRSTVSATNFDIVCEIEPATRPDLTRVRHQIGVLSPVTAKFLIPDNHIGRATVSSIAVAHEVALMGGRAIACLNARDRNLLGFRRDLLTAAAYGVDEFLFVYGDRPETGSRSDDLTVRSMIAEARLFADQRQAQPIRIGVTTGLGPVPAWKLAADMLFVQVSYDLDALIAWRDRLRFKGPVYAGVMVLPSTAMARKLAASVPQLAAPTGVLERLDREPDAGVDIACELIDGIRNSSAFDGAHLIPVNRYRDIAARLESTRA